MNVPKRIFSGGDGGPSASRFISVLLGAIVAGLCVVAGIVALRDSANSGQIISSLAQIVAGPTVAIVGVMTALAVKEKAPKPSPIAAGPMQVQGDVVQQAPTVQQPGSTG